MGLFSSSEKSDKPKIKKLKEDGCVVTLQIEVPPQKIQDAVQNALVRLQGQARVPGFRPGKAPLEVVEKQYGGHAREKAIDDVVRATLPEAMKEHELHPVSTPTLGSIKLDQGKPLVYEVAIETAPKFEAKNYKKLAAVRKKYAATDEELNNRINELREGNARLEKATEDAIGKTHYVVIDYKATGADGKPLKGLKGEDVLFDMASPNSVEGLVEGLAGAKRGEARAIKVTLNKQPATFEIVVKEIKTKILPAIDEDFAKDVGAASLDELKKNLRGLIDEEGKRNAERELVGQIEEGLLKANPFAVPPSLVDAELERMLERLKRQVLGPKRDWSPEELEKLRKEFRPKAENEIRLSYLLRSIADTEKIETTKEELDAELKRSIDSAESDAEKSNIRKLFEGREEEISAMLRERKVMDFLKTSAAITEA